MSVTSEYLVSGMHCHHCVSSVTEEVSIVSGVTDVRVDLDSGQLIVISDIELPFESIEAAVDEAGYSVLTA
jgi:copper chaperone CopZ